MLIAKLVVLQLASLVAPVVTLFYKKGIWLTPDDTVSPYGQYEPFMRKIYKLGSFIGDWWWLGIRNPALGLAYKWKPDIFKGVQTYDNFHKVRKFWGPVKYTEVAGYPEWVVTLGFFHIIVGYRMTPVYNTMGEVRPINMDARPILSIRFGKDD